MASAYLFPSRKQGFSLDLPGQPWLALGMAGNLAEKLKKGSQRKTVPPLATREARLALQKRIRQDLERFREENHLPPARLDPKKIHLENLCESVELVDMMLPDMVVGLWEDFQSSHTSVNDRVKIFEVFCKFGLTHERLTQGMGLVKELASQNGGLNIGTLLNIDVSQLRDMGTKEITAELVGRREEEECVLTGES